MYTNSHNQNAYMLITYTTYRMNNITFALYISLLIIFKDVNSLDLRDQTI